MLEEIKLLENEIANLTSVEGIEGILNKHTNNNFSIGNIYYILKIYNFAEKWKILC